MIARPLLVVVLALLAANPRAAAFVEQYPRGLMSSGSARGCMIETRPVAFGNYDPAGYQSLAALGRVIYTCFSSQPLFPIRNIRIEISRGGAATYQRRMSSGLELLYYNLYLDSSHSTVWGDGSGGSQYYVDPQPPNYTPVSVPIHALIPGRQDVTAGQYGDTLQVKILF